jgi:mono/diheme cytochrome c family protein
MFVAAGACAGQQPPAATAKDPSLVRGEQIIQRYCASCHALTPDGRSPHAPAPSLARISENYPVTALEESLAEGMVVGHPDMPEFKLGPDDIRAVIAYLSSIQVRRAG